VGSGSAAICVGVLVTLINEATKFATAETSNGVGFYAFPSLTPGTYDIAGRLSLHGKPTAKHQFLGGTK
jgi:hypothetical protein